MICATTLGSFRTAREPWTDLSGFIGTSLDVNACETEGGACEEDVGGYEKGVDGRESDSWVLPPSSWCRPPASADGTTTAGDAKRAFCRRPRARVFWTRAVCGRRRSSSHRLTTARTRMRTASSSPSPSADCKGSWADSMRTASDSTRASSRWRAEAADGSRPRGDSARSGAERPDDACRRPRSGSCRRTTWSCRQRELFCRRRPVFRRRTPVWARGLGSAFGVSSPFAYLTAQVAFCPLDFFMGLSFCSDRSPHAAFRSASIGPGVETTRRRQRATGSSPPWRIIAQAR